jgi:hypothetical protein
MQWTSAILQSVAFPALKCFAHYLINSTIFGKKVIEHKMCFDFFYKFFSDTLPIPRRNERGVIKNVYRSSYEVAIILARF